MRPILTGLLAIVLILSACSQPVAPQPNPVPSTATPPSIPTATPDPFRSFEQQLESAWAAGYLPASYTSDPGGDPSLLAGLDLAPFRASGLLPLSPDGQEIGRISGEQLSLPRLEAIPYPNPATGELPIYSFSNTDGAWNIYTNHGGPALKVPVSLPVSLADLVGIYSPPGKDPALVAAKLMPDGSIKITPIVFTEGEEVVFGAQSVTIAGQEVFYNQLTSAWEALLTPTPDELKYEIGDDGKTLIIDGQEAYSTANGVLKKWDLSKNRRVSIRDTNNNEIAADKFITTEHGVVVVKEGRMVALIDENGQVVIGNQEIVDGENTYAWNPNTHEWSLVIPPTPTPTESFLTEPIRNTRPLEELRKLKFVSVEELLPTTVLEEKKYLGKEVSGHLWAYEINSDKVTIWLLLKNNRMLKTQISAVIIGNAMAIANNFPVFDGGKISAQKAQQARELLDQLLKLQSEAFIKVSTFPTKSDCLTNINPYVKSICSLIDDGKYPLDDPAKLDSAVSGMIQKAPADLTSWDELSKMPTQDIGVSFTLRGR
jgi:hypothetical protein